MYYLLQQRSCSEYFSHFLFKAPLKFLVLLYEKESGYSSYISSERIMTISKLLVF